jgi:hypothetical protein
MGCQGLSADGGALISTLRISAFLCASAVYYFLLALYRRDAEERRDTQRGLCRLWLSKVGVNI